MYHWAIGGYLTTWWNVIYKLHFLGFSSTTIYTCKYHSIGFLLQQSNRNLSQFKPRFYQIHDKQQTSPTWPHNTSINLSLPCKLLIKKSQTTIVGLQQLPTIQLESLFAVVKVTTNNRFNEQPARLFHLQHECETISFHSYYCCCFFYSLIEGHKKNVREILKTYGNGTCRVK